MALKYPEGVTRIVDGIYHYDDTIIVHIHLEGVIPPVWKFVCRCRYPVANTTALQTTEGPKAPKHTYTPVELIGEPRQDSLNSWYMYKGSCPDCGQKYICFTQLFPRADEQESSNATTLQI